MAVETCAAPAYFTSPSQVGFANSNVLFFFSASHDFGSDFPFIPVGIINPADNMLDVAKTKLYADLFPLIFNAVLAAQYNYLTGGFSSGNPSYTAGNRGNYLSRRLAINGSIDRQNRFNQLALFIQQFWAHSSGTVNDLQMISYQNFIANLCKLTDLNYWLPNGSYHTNDTDPLGARLAAIEAAEGWVNVNVASLQLTSIG